MKHSIASQKTGRLLRRLCNAIGEAEERNAGMFLAHLVGRIRAKDKEIKGATILIGYGGGKDSSWVVAFLRVAQLLCRQKYGECFRMKIVTMVHLGMPREVLLNIDRTYRRLGLYEEPDAELQIFCYGHKAAFSRDYEMPKEVRKMLREDILLAGHRYSGNPRGTFCVSCNLHLINAGISNLGERIDFILTGDSLNELGQYYNWANSLFLRFGLGQSTSTKPVHMAAEKAAKLSYIFHSQLLERHDSSLLHRLPPAFIEPCIDPSFISIFDYTDYKCGAHWDFLCGFLGFRFYEKSFNFTESDCQHPLLMAHLRGIKAEICGRQYAEGIRDYLQLANELMEKKGFPEKLVAIVNARYATGQKILKMRKKAEKYAEETLGIRPEQIACLVYSPFGNRGKNLMMYLEKTAPEYAGQCDAVIGVLDGSSGKNTARIRRFLEARAGIPLGRIRELFHAGLAPGSSVFGAMIESDPHKKEIEYTLNGRKVRETIFGR